MTLSERSAPGAVGQQEDAALGCVLAVRNRPVQYLARAFQSYAYQTLQPADKVLLDYGSSPGWSQAYAELCRRYAWRLVRAEPAEPRWHLAAAYNAAVCALGPGVGTVFKSDVDVLLGPDVLRTAARVGWEGFCQFPYFTTAQSVRYPAAVSTPEDFLAVLRQCPGKAPSAGRGLAAFPRAWFEEVGGFDLRYRSWGSEDDDLRQRAEWSLPVVDVDPREAVLVHQWHPPSLEATFPEGNREYLENMRRLRQVVRNGGQLLPDAVARLQGVQTRQPRIVLATRSVNDELYRLSGEFLSLPGLERRRFTDTDCLGYLRGLLQIEADWVINVDEDAFVLAPDRLLTLVGHMEGDGFAACGLPDGGVVSIRSHNPVACNVFFNVFDLRRVRRVWAGWESAVATPHRTSYEGQVPTFARRTEFRFDHFEPYYGLFFALLDAGERILYLDGREWQDGVSTLLQDADGEPLLLHCWYGRDWATRSETRLRFQKAIDFARQNRKVPRPSAAPAVQDRGPSPPRSSNLGKWEPWYRNSEAQPYGDTLTYERAAAFLGGLQTVEDWGCGMAWFKRYLNASVRYRGIDGSRSPFADEVADLTCYTSRVEGILLRHVLEHDDGWEAILGNAVRSFTQRMVLVLFTPFAETTRRIGHVADIDVPDLAFAKEDLVRHFAGLKWTLEENLRTRTQYGVEHVFYLEK